MSDNDPNQRTINNKSTNSNKSNLPSFNLNTNPKSINKLYNPSVAETNNVIYLFLII